MIDPRLAWFSMGALSGAVLFGRPWHLRFSRYGRRGSNPPAPGRKPAPPAGPPEPPAAAQLIRFDEGQTQRGNGNGNGGPTTPKPSIKPQPTGGYLVQEGRPWNGYQPRPWGGTPDPPLSKP